MSRFLSALLAVAVLAGCDSGFVGKTEAQLAYEQASDAAVRSLEAAIRPGLADDVASCRVLPLGVNNNGRPTFFRVYSVTSGDQALIRTLAERIAEIDRKAIADGVLDYPYDAGTPTAVELRDGRCQFEPQIVVN